MSSSSPLPNNTNASYSFEEFLRGWCQRLDRLSAEITAAVDTKNGEEIHIDDMDAKLLIARALGHFEEYYEHKSRAANLNGFALFAPSFCSPFECAFLWVAGFRPRVLLHLVSSSVNDLSPHQIEVLDRLKRETMINEKAVEDELAKIQETAAAPPLINALREAARLQEGQSLTTPNEQIQKLNASFEAVIASADSLRVTTGAKAAEILKPTQCLRFLVAALKLMQRMRYTGMERDNLAGDLDRSNINIYIG